MLESLRSLGEFTWQVCQCLLLCVGIIVLDKGLGAIKEALIKKPFKTNKNAVRLNERGLPYGDPPV